LTDITPLLLKGALLAKDPSAFDSVPRLEEFEREAVRNEVLRKWRQLKAL